MVQGWFRLEMSPETIIYAAWRCFLETLRLHKFYAFVESKECRHRQLLEHFGQSLAGSNCGACDACGELGAACGGTRLKDSTCHDMSRLGGGERCVEVA